MQEGKDILRRKLDKFIKKYYINELIKGGILSATILLSIILFLSIAEYLGNFESAIRKAFFFTLITVSTVVLVRFIFRPVFKLLKIGKIISYEEAAIFIGNHFTQVKDKLLNYLQLEKLGQQKSDELILAGIEQKTRELSPVPFTSALDLSENKKYLKYLIPTIIFFVGIFSYEPSIIKESTERIVQYNKTFEKPLPYQIIIQNKTLKAAQSSDFTIEIKTEGKLLPKEIFLVSGDGKYKMKKLSANRFSFTFKNLQKDLYFSFETPLFTTQSYLLKVLPQPKAKQFKITFNYPSYLHKKTDTQENIGDIVVPEGTNAFWEWSTQNTQQVYFVFPDTVISAQPSAENKFTLTRILKKNERYGVVLKNKDISADTNYYTIQVIPDKYPAITLQAQKDSVNLKITYFKGSISDDYGLSRLQFRFKNLSYDTAQWNTTDIPINHGLRDIFYYLWDLSNYPVRPGDQIQYYFTVWDNDGFHGPKATSTNKAIMKIPDPEELKQLKEESGKQLKNAMNDALSEAQQLQKEFDKLYDKLAQKKELSWEDKKQIKELLKKEKTLENKIQNIQQQNQENFLRNQSFEKPSEELLKKQEQLQKLFEEIIPPELKEQFKQLDELMEKLNKDQIQEMLKNIELSNKDIEKELDRTLELFKQMEFEQKLEETIEKTQKIKEEQEKLLQETSEKQKDSKQLKEKQEEIKDKFQQLKEDLQSLEEKNNNLENPHDLPNMDEEMQAIEQEMQNSSENLEKNNPKKSSKNQQKALEQLQKMQNKMSDLQQEMQQEQHEEDLNALRQILDNLLKVSFSQENLIEELKNVEPKDPKFVQIGKQQKELQDDIKLIEDSLLALSKRVPEISPLINREVAKIHSNMTMALSLIQDRKTYEAMEKQQFLLTSINNLALLLDEIIQQLQQQMAQQKFGNNSCSKPGNNNLPKAGSLKELQQQLNKQLESLKKQMEQGNKQGNKPGKSSFSKQLAQLAAQQEAIRNELRKMAEQLEKEGNIHGKTDLEKLAKMMDETETDLVNKKITQETLLRQQEILTKLLEHEKAEREKEMDQKREAHEALNYEKRNKIEFLEYKKAKEKEMELYKTIPPKLKPFYKNKVSQYFQNL